MIIMKTDATQEQIAQVVKEIKRYGLRADVSKGEYRTVIGLVGDESQISFAHFATLPGVKEAMISAALFGAMTLTISTPALKAAKADKAGEPE